jgi:hypothetical protein
MRFVWMALLALVTPAAAAEVGPCEGLDSISFLIGQTKPYSQGKITIAHVDTDGEPVCCSEHLLIFIPSPEIGRQCFALSDKAAKDDGSARGFSTVAFDKISASYDQNKGLLLTVPYTLYNGGEKGPLRSTSVRVNLQGQGSVKIER